MWRVAEKDFPVAPPRGERGLKYIMYRRPAITVPVAPPRGERGLKFEDNNRKYADAFSRSPSWGAWIEILVSGSYLDFLPVAPPRGERGLKLSQN